MLLTVKHWNTKYENLIAIFKKKTNLKINALRKIDSIKEITIVAIIGFKKMAKYNVRFAKWFFT